MLIQSKFKDYYDYIQKDGRDVSLVYNRKEEIIEESRKWDMPLESWESRLVAKDRWKLNLTRYDLFRVQFCGKVYVGSYLGGTPSFDPAKVHIIEKAAKNGMGWQSVDLSKPFCEAYPIAVVYPVKVAMNKFVTRTIVNCELRRFNFSQIMPPEQAFQELAMWHANRKEAPPIPAVPDKILAEAKGFNKHSFRKEKK